MEKASTSWQCVGVLCYNKSAFDKLLFGAGQKKLQKAHFSHSGKLLVEKNIKLIRYSKWRILKFKYKKVFMYILVYLVFAGLCCNSLQASDNNHPSKSWVQSLLMCSPVWNNTDQGLPLAGVATRVATAQEAQYLTESAKKARTLATVVAIRDELDRNLPIPHIQNLVAEMLTDRYLCFNVETLWNKYKQNQDERDAQYSVIRLGIGQIKKPLADGTTEITRLRAQFWNNQWVDGIVERSSTVNGDARLLWEDKNKNWQSWRLRPCVCPLIDRRYRPRITSSSTQTDWFPRRQEQSMTIEQDNQNPRKFTIDILGAQDSDHVLVEALMKLNPERFKRHEITNPAYVQPVDQKKPLWSNPWDTTFVDHNKDCKFAKHS